MPVKEESKTQYTTYQENTISSHELCFDKNEIKERDADEVLHFIGQYDGQVEELTPQQDKKFRRKNFAFIVSMTMLVTLVLFIDKATIGYTTILGIYEDTSIDKADFNNLNSIFYGGYLAAQIPGHFLMQKLPLGKYLAGTIFLWAVIIGFHAACKNYSSLMALRFLLGLTEAVVVPALEMTLGMFLTTEEREISQPIFWASTALAPLLSSFISFGLLHTNTSIFPWRIFMAINAGVSLVLFVIVFLIYPDNPTKAKNLSLNEKIHAIKRVQESTRSSIEQKVLKNYQVLECLKDPVSWLFLGQSFTLMLSNSLTYQQNQLYVDIGVDKLGSTLCSAAGSGFDILIYMIAALLIKKFPNENAYFGASFLLPSIAASIGMVTINWENKYALLAMMILAGWTKGVTYIVALGGQRLHVQDIPKNCIGMLCL